MRVLFVLGSGGHTARGLILSRQLQAEKYFMVPWESEVTKQKVKSNYYSVVSPRFRAKDSRILSVFRTLFLFIHSLLILLVVRPDVLISTGSGLTLPPFLMARLFGIKTVFIESPSRVYRPSIAGRLLMGKTDLWLSSWPELAERYPCVDYRGMIIESPVLKSVDNEQTVSLFVTVGTSLPHDELIRTIDNLVGSGKVKGTVVAQIGGGEYIPRHIDFFRFSPSLDTYYSSAEVILSSCGAGTIMENVVSGRRLVVIQNPDITGGHEWELVAMMEKNKHLIWCRSLDDLTECLERARTDSFLRFVPERLDINEVLAQVH
ncbi:MAG: hypothetical protein DRO87_07350 [Candidatus Thorarchaeota archaeon]|nr:MAG: hypothetical protein DRP09_09150 [Candidatus Thorarchaeota archaeon]RLI57090.1 MAG: hypothetical protein DRO87_07350 [Candidatus Thorarchaeota archaeon]